MPPSKTLEDAQDAIITALKKGNYRQTAAKAAGVSRRTLYNWLNKGKANLDAVASGQADLDEWGLFYQEVEAAEASAETTIVENVVEMSVRLGKPEVLLKFLERRYPDRWGRRKVEVVRSTADVAAEQADRRKALRQTITERKLKLADATTVH